MRAESFPARDSFLKGCLMFENHCCEAHVESARKALRDFVRHSDMDGAGDFDTQASQLLAAMMHWRQVAKSITPACMRQLLHNSGPHACRQGSDCLNGLLRNFRWKS
jgi:hypothetical protein